MEVMQTRRRLRLEESNRGRPHKKWPALPEKNGRDVDDQRGGGLVESDRNMLFGKTMKNGMTATTGTTNESGPSVNSAGVQESSPWFEPNSPTQAAYQEWFDRELQDRELSDEKANKM
mmetsp:Transcript_53739/g.73401  ORF Transcript_53739/g.73401 Transcript_53739/m.73401 type:complete len:118 (-) Transcript_53739:652-1005(-)